MHAYVFFVSRQPVLTTDSFLSLKQILLYHCIFEKNRVAWMTLS